MFFKALFLTYKNYYENLPLNWAIETVGNLVILNPKNILENDEICSFIPMALIDQGYKNNHKSIMKKWEEVKKGFTHFQSGDIGIAKITPCFENRKSVVFNNLMNDIGAGTTELHILRPIHLSPYYLLYVFKSQNFIDYGVKNFTGTAGQKRIGSDSLKKYIVPVPPINEQEKITNMINLLFATISILENEYF